MKEANVVVVLKFPNSNRHIIGTSEEHISVDRHARYRVSMSSELRHMVVCSNVPNVYLLVATSYYHIPMSSLLC